jgi:hypothetical protein
MRRHVLVGLALAAVTAVPTGCGGAPRERKPLDGIRVPPMDPMEKHYPDVLQARLVRIGDHRYDLTVTLSSPYDTRFRYATGWRLLTARGDWLGERSFARHHADEQPWTRHLRVRIPSDVRDVVVEGKDLIYGYGGGAFFLRVP